MHREHTDHPGHPGNEHLFAHKAFSVVVLVMRSFPGRYCNLVSVLDCETSFSSFEWVRKELLKLTNQKSAFNTTFSH